MKLFCNFLIMILYEKINITLIMSKLNTIIYEYNNIITYN